ncbi:MAG: HEAT repeat domain-containing protein [Methylococcaceae bacterium]|nr:HEAT repeat domain-containing protein [Methylococcaceae bacterium]
MTENSPYLGLRPFQEKEQNKFFGRLQEIHILTDKILAHRLTLLVAASGVGKSSLLQAGVMPALRATGMADLIYHNDWAVNPAEALKKTIVAHFIAQQRVNADYQADFSLPLVEFLQIHALLGSGTMVILLDQFEEFFYYQRFSQQRDEFIRQLASAIHDTNTPTAFVFSMREDFAMEMEAFKTWFAGIFNNTYRIEKLELDAARLAIVEPVKAAGFTYQPELIELLLKDLGQRERGARLDLQHIDERDLIMPLVEPPHLQIVCQQLWLKASASTACEITVAHYQELKGASGILKRYFDDKMAMLNAEQQGLASKAFDLLVSQHGAKMSYPLDELAKLLNKDALVLEKTLEELQKSAILRRVLRQGHPWYELYHDIFAKSIVAWNQAYKRQQLKKMLIIRGSAAVLAGVALFLAYDGWENYHSRHFRLGKETVSERVELYQGVSGSWDIFHQRKFVYESDYQRTDIEADKRFETATIAELNQTVVMQIGQLPLAQRFTAYAQAGLWANADKVFDAIRKASDKNLISNLATQLSITRAQQTIDHLLKLLKDNDAGVRQAAIRILSDLKSQDAIKPLLDLLKDNDAGVRSAAIQALSDLKAQDAINPLLELIKDDELRYSAIQALKDLNAQDSMINPLLELLKDKDDNVRYAAIQALSDLKEPRAINPLLDLLKDKNADAGVRNATIQVLSDLKAQEAIKPLLELLKDKDSRYAAIQALTDLNAQDAIKPLLELLKDKDSRYSAIQALTDLNAQDAINPLLDLLKDKDAGVRNAAIQALSNLKEPRAINPLLELLKDKDAGVRNAAIQALTDLNAQDAINPLLELLKDKDAGVRNAAIQALTDLNAQDIIKPLLELLKDKDANVRQAAIQLLSNLKRYAINPLLESLKNNDANVRYAAIQALSDLKAQEAIKPLLKLLKDNEAYVRSAAIQALSNLNAQEAINPLLELLKDNDADVRTALKQMKVLMMGSDNKAPTPTPTPTPTNELITQLKDNDLSTQQTAALALSKLPQPPAELAEWQSQQITELELALKDKAANKNTIAYNLGFVPVEKAVELLALLLKDEELEVVKNAVASLGNIAEGQTIGSQSDQTAEQYLLKIASDLTQTDYLRLAAVDALGNTDRPEIAALLFNALQDKNQATLHLTITYWLAKMPYQADKKAALLALLQQRLSDLEKDKTTWREQRDAYKPTPTDDEKSVVCYGDNVDANKTSWCDDYQIYQYAYAIARIDPQNAGIELLNHPSYQAREAAIRALAEKANGDLLQKLIVYYQAFNWKDLPSPRPYATYRAIDKTLEQLEVSGTENDLKILQDLKAKLIIPAKSQNPSDKEQQQDAMIQRFDWTIAELSYRLKNKNEAR